MTISGGGFTFSFVSIGGTWRWMVSVNNLKVPGQLYQIDNIVTPFGPLEQVYSPIPSDVIENMNESIKSIRNQMKPHLKIVSNSTPFSVSVTEGDPKIYVGSVRVMNDGGFGSFLSVSATPNCQWLSVFIPEIVGLEVGSTAVFDIYLIPESLLAVSSPFLGSILIQDLSGQSESFSVPVTVVVMPRPVIGVSVESISFEWSHLTPSPSTQYITVTNTGPGTSLLSFSVNKLSNSSWLSIPDGPIGPLSSGSSTTISISTSYNSIPQLVGTYTDKIRISSSNASNSPIDIPVNLNVIV